MPSTVPTPAGTLVFAGGSGDEGSSGAVSQGIWQSDASVADAAEAYGATLASAGFTVDPGMSVQDGSVANCTGNGLAVGVIVAEGEGGSGATISVTVNAQG